MRDATYACGITDDAVGSAKIGVCNMKTDAAMGGSVTVGYIVY